MQHKAVGLGNIHQIHNYEFDTIEERDAFIPSLEDLKLICLVNSPFSYYALKSIEPVEWKPLSTVTINLEDFSVLSAEETVELVSQKQSIYDISSSEYKCGYTRGGKEVFGIEVDCGALPNATQKLIAINGYNTNNKYWINTSESYTTKADKTAVMPIPYIPVGANTANNTAWVNTHLINGNILIQTYSNLTSYVETKVVLNYTKG